MLKLIPSSTRAASVACLILLATGCGQSDSSESEPSIPSTSTPSTSTPATPAPAAEAAPASTVSPDSTSASASASASIDDEAWLKRGKIAFLRCRACHTLKQGEDHLTGPNLYSFFGSLAGSKEDYAYSDELKNSGITWSADTLGAWLASPNDFIQGNRMVFAGLPREKDRTALIKYLKQETK